MNTLPRHEYVFDLTAASVDVPDDDVPVRQPEPSDAEMLAQLMFDAYLDTIDYEGETLEEARQEVARYLSGRPLLEFSWLRLVDAVPVSASLVAWSTRDCPIVAYVMTAPAWKGKSLASGLLGRSLVSLADAEYSEVRAVITEGNVPSETIFTRAGFRRV